jgi:hypothetical protein
LLGAAILLPTLAFVVYLAYWAYTVADWTWFGLLLAASVGLLAFAAAPDLFSLSEAGEPQERPGEWRLTMSSPRERPGKTDSQGSPAIIPGPKQKSVSPGAKAPNRSA